MACHPTIAALQIEIEEAFSNLKSIVELSASKALASHVRVSLANSSIVMLVSVSEEALRNIFSQYLNLLESSGLSFSKMRQKLQKANIDCSARQLISYFAEGKKADLLSVARNIVNCVDSGSGWFLHREEIVKNDVNFKSKHLTEIAKRIGIEDIWRKIAASEPVSIYYEEIDMDRIEAKAIAEWNEIFEERNTIVHSISTASGWGSEKITECIDFVTLILNTIAFVVSEDFSAVSAHANR